MSDIEANLLVEEIKSICQENAELKAQLNMENSKKSWGKGLADLWHGLDGPDYLGFALVLCVISVIITGTVAMVAVISDKGRNCRYIPCSSRLGNNNVQSICLDKWAQDTVVVPVVTKEELVPLLNRLTEQCKEEQYKYTSAGSMN